MCINLQEKIFMPNTRRSILGIGLRSLTTLGVASVFKNTALSSTNGILDHAVVTINLVGGNDSNNLIVPAAAADYDLYSRGRGELAIPRSALLDITAAHTGASYGLHPNLGELRRLYNQGALAILANVGTLVQPTTRNQFLAHQAQLPKDLFQHTGDQRWAFVRPGFATTAWAGAQQQPVSGQPPQVFTFSSGLSVVPSQRTGIQGHSLDNPQLLQAIASAPRFRTVFPATGLGAELLQVAKLLYMGPSLGLTRPVFTVSLTGFDTHLSELAQQAVLFTTLSQAMAAFYEATHELGLASRVTTYTDTEFNRTLKPNASHGSDHAWGGHQLVMGGAVKGGDVFGQFPSLQLAGPNDAGNTGIWIPTTSNQQYQATVAEWYGVQPLDVARVLPGVQNFAPATLGFLM
jgi:uncharacterized protein (DUF1501 family)